MKWRKEKKKGKKRREILSKSGFSKVCFLVVFTECTKTLSPGGGWQAKISIQELGFLLEIS